MIESQTELPVQEGGPATIGTQGRQVVTALIGRAGGRIRTLSGVREAQGWGGLGPLVSSLAGQFRFQTFLTRIFSWARAGIGDGPLLNRFALHLVVIFLALGVVAISQVNVPQVELLLPTPTPAPDLGSHTVTTPPTSRNGNRYVNNNTPLFQVPVPHTVRAERDRMQIITYTVQANDNVFRIAQGFGLNAETILWANPKVEQAPDLLSVGQVLTVLPVNGVLHTVQAGDTVEKLAKKYETTVEKIVGFEGNELEEPYVLTAGQQVVIPDGRKQIVPWQNIYPMTRVGNPPAGAPKGSGRFAWPARGLLTQGYWSGHMGIDVASSRGTPIYAADDGYVVLSGQDTWGYGNQIVIDHGNGYLTRYAHLQKLMVKAGDIVKKNQQIATMGSTGRSTGPHLHFEVIYAGVRRNPLGFLP